MNVAVIGAGYWGSNLLRIFSSLPNAHLEAVCDKKRECLDRAKKSYPWVKIFQDYKEVLGDPRIEVVVVATEAQFHYQIARECLSAGKHVLVEKPLALSQEQCKDLIDIAKGKNRVLMVGHTFEYNAAVRKLKEYITASELGKIYYIYSQRLNLGIIRQDINAMWNFAPHDISIILYLLGEEPVSVSAKGLSYIQEGIEDVVFMNLDFPGNVSAHIHISWLDPNKVRKTTVVGSKKMIVYDDLASDAKITVYDKGVEKKSFGEFKTFGDFQLLLRAGDMHIPKIDFIEPLKVECSHFVECIEKGKKPLTDGFDGLRVVRVLEAAQKSLKNNSAPQKPK